MEYRIIRHLQERHLPQLMHLYQKEFWCNTRKAADVLRMLDNTDIVIGVVDEHDELCGFCRVLTDYVYKATLYDVIVASDKRRQGVGDLIMNSVLSLPELRQVEHIDLNCLTSMLPFYRRYGFTDALEGLQQMRRFHQNSAPQNETQNELRFGTQKEMQKEMQKDTQGTNSSSSE